jgi:hypothetical protein
MGTFAEHGHKIGGFTVLREPCDDLCLVLQVQGLGLFEEALEFQKVPDNIFLGRVCDGLFWIRLFIDFFNERFGNRCGKGKFWVRVWVFCLGSLFCRIANLDYLVLLCFHYSVNL